MRLGAHLGWIVLVASCRLDFQTRDLSTIDAPADVAIDAPMPCVPLVNGATIDDCIAAFANPAAATDQVVYACAQSCLFGRCRINDASSCGTCACPAYAYSSAICDPVTAQCGAPLSGTGCIGLDIYMQPPTSCPAGQTAEGACVMRYLFTVGDC